MKIAIDGYEANIANRVGIGTYAYEILKGLHQLIHQSGCSHIVRIYLPTPPVTDMPPQSKQWQYVVRQPKKLWTYVGLPLAIATDGFNPAVFFSPTHYIPHWVKVPRVMAVMDLSFLHYPDLFRAKDLQQLTHGTKYSLIHSQQVLTISEFSRNAILKTYSLRPDQVTVTYLGFRMPKNQPTVDSRAIYKLQQPYILSVGTLQPRKNFAALIEAFAVLKKQSQYQALDLVIVGKKGWLYEDILAAPVQYGVEDSVKFLEFVPDDHLPALYQQAECFALVSLYEGFGLPVLEAMAHGSLVVVSNTSSLPEIAGDVGFQVDPTSITGIVDGLQQALTIKDTPAGKARIQAGLERVQLFSWEKAAKTTLDILEKVGNNQP
jgi:glycosyltransferase involved in cell wall biosynthesis